MGEADLTFDEYCARNNVRPAEYPTAFAAYLYLISDGEWDGDMEKVSPAQ